MGTLAVEDDLRVFSVVQVCRVLRVSDNTVHRLYETGELDGFRATPKGARNITAPSLVAYMRRNGVPLNRLKLIESEP